MRLEQPAVIENVVIERGTLGAKRAAIDGMVGIAFDMDHLGCDVLGLVADGVNDYAAAHRAIGASGASLRGARDL